MANTYNTTHCEACKIYQAKKDEFLKRYNSAYDAAIEMMFFMDDCKKSCDKVKPEGTSV